MSDTGSLPAVNEEPKKKMNKQQLEARKKVDIEKCIKFYELGLNINEISKIYNVNWQTIKKILDDYGVQDPNINHYRDHRERYLSKAENDILNSLSDADLMKASLKDKAYAFGVFHNANRLERNESTSNVANIFDSLVKKAEND